jgi:hypothetical protein
MIIPLVAGLSILMISGVVNTYISCALFSDNSSYQNKNNS